MDWELSSVRIHGWIKKKYVESHIVYMYCTYAVYVCFYVCYVCTYSYTHIYMHVAYKYTQTHTNTHTLSIRVEKIRDTRETRIYTTRSECQQYMCLAVSMRNTCSAYHTCHTTTKRTRAFFVSIFRSLIWPINLTTRKELVHIVFQQGKTYTIAIFTGPIIIFIFVTRAVVMSDNFSNIRRAPSVRRSCNQRKTRPSIDDVLPTGALCC